MSHSVIKHWSHANGCANAGCCISWNQQSGSYLDVSKLCSPPYSTKMNKQDHKKLKMMEKDIPKYATWLKWVSIRCWMYNTRKSIFSWKATLVWHWLRICISPKIYNSLPAHNPFKLLSLAHRRYYHLSFGPDQCTIHHLYTDKM